MTDQIAVDPAVVSRALISVSNKDGLAELAAALSAFDIEILSTGGSAAFLRQAGVEVIDVSEHTGFPEIMGGRVKTLHPKIHGGILGRRNEPGDRAAMEEHTIPPIDLVVVNLYPFAETIAKQPGAKNSGTGGTDFDEAIENIDIGGPALIRAAAKNHAHVGVVTDPADYQEVIAALSAHGGNLPAALTRRLAAKAFGHTAAYDGLINEWLSAQAGLDFPHRMTIAGTLSRELRYGENPHQRAALYLPVSPNGQGGVAQAQQVQGKELSYNNLNDADAAWALVCEFEAPAVAIIKHANPCGVARVPDADKAEAGLMKAYEAALACDPVSAFGGVVAVNRVLDEELAQAITAIFTEVVIAPAADDAAIAVFAAKKNLRLLLTGATEVNQGPARRVSQLADGFLVQDFDDGMPAELQVVSDRSPSSVELADMDFAFRVAKHVKSNAIVYAKNLATVGIGAGQMSRVDSARIAATKAIDAAEKAGSEQPGTVGSAVASDAFFPFADGLTAAIEAGAVAVIQPGGSVRDNEVIAAANDAGIAMVFTGMRHFRH